MGRSQYAVTSRDRGNGTRSRYGRKPTLRSEDIDQHGKLLSWSDNFTVGHEELDQQHRNFFDYLNWVHARRLRGTHPDDLKSLIFELEGDLMHHFSYEEDSLVRVDFPYLLQHASEHRALIRQFQTVRENVFNLAGWGSRPDVAWPILEFMVRMTVGHILKTDLEYRDYFQAKNRPAAE